MDVFSPEELNQFLRTRALGRRTVLLDSAASTNTVARGMVRDGDSEGIVVISDTQTAGRGRRGRSWVSEAGCGLWMTAVITPFMAQTEMQKLTLAVGLAVCRAVREMTADAVIPSIKWPNDVVIRGRKICGILCEAVNDSAGQPRVLAGVGINTSKPQAGYGDAADVAISLEQVWDRKASRLALAALVLNHLEALLDGWQNRGYATVAEGYRQYMLPPGTLIIIPDGTRSRQGTIEGVDDDGALLIRLGGDTLERIISGEITLRGVGGYV